MITTAVKQYNTHVVFADREMSPNLGPVLDERLIVKQVVVLYSENLHENAKRLEKIYRDHELKVDCIQLTPAFDIDSIIQELLDILKPYPFDSLAINLSCASKMFTLACFKAFENTTAGLYYLLPNYQLNWLQPKTNPSLNIADNLMLEEFLQAHGIEHSKPVCLSPSQADFANGLVNAIQKIILEHKALKLYQRFSTRHARGKQVKLIKHKNRYYFNEVNHKTHQKADLLVGLLKKLHNHNIVNLISQNSELTLQIEKDTWKRTFFEGGWLEYLTYRTVMELKSEISKIKDVAFGVKLERHNAFDEADVLFIANNQLFVVECKTGANANINLHLQRLDSLKNRLGGVSAHALLITTEEIGDNLHKAQLLNVGVIDGSELHDMKIKLKNWILNELQH